jgi:hypothetical protein
MAMTVAIQNLTGAGPASANVSAITHNREDTASGTTLIPIPTNPGTNFGWVKSMIVNISATGGLTMTNIRVGKISAEAVTGTLVWHVTSHALASYVQAVSSPGSTGDNNVTAPTLNGASATELPLSNSSPSPYAAGPFSAVAQVGNLVELSLGVDGTCVNTGTAVLIATARWTWTEA